jgi:hypothetical protein
MNQLKRGTLTASNIPSKNRFASRGPNDFENARPIMVVPQQKMHALIRILVGTRTTRKAVKPQQTAS